VRTERKSRRSFSIARATEGYLRRGVRKSAKRRGMREGKASHRPKGDVAAGGVQEGAEDGNDVESEKVIRLERRLISVREGLLAV